MMRPRDPRVRQTINQISHNLETANETAQEGLYTFSHHYILPCFATIGNCIYACAAPCLPSREDQLRRRRRGRAEAIFDFYDDWDNDDADDRLLGWGTDELDRLLAGSGLTRGSSEQPRRQRKMSYGTRRARRKSSVLVPDDRNDPTVIPSSSFLGFLERFPWRFGARGLKYQPSVADLQEHPTGLRMHAHEDEPLMEAEEENEGPSSNGKTGRYRSSTQSSRETANSLSSRGDLIPSDEEEDAVPLDDEFAMALGSRRGTGLESEDQFSDKPASMRSVSGSFSLASKESKKKRKKRSSRLRSPQNSYIDVAQDITAPSIVDLHKEEEQAERQEESEIIRKRLAARQLASSRGLSQARDQSTPQPLVLPSPTVSTETALPELSVNTPLESAGESELSTGRMSGDFSQTEPFPPLPLTSPAASEGLEPEGQPDSAENNKEDPPNH
ncbi:hypothetical protein BDV38DRAFT_273630 [Aspergillus pseudotamarii]|uniref:Uncharacterized protein n=1 Tax=Aspergillus pseudotamarii TaxID=132259 RepID=A0A5N6SHW1_ASPPS|nr:uncharacterized protein BDV38DRAFT_273630 [Aspergillus pseudotamarii]KAE8134276.1 hypothetical protein BDV38DRAFT_273630 [Aspergillus pseudotamarii]